MRRAERLRTTDFKQPLICIVESLSVQTVQNLRHACGKNTQPLVMGKLFCHDDSWIYDLFYFICLPGGGVLADQLSDEFDSRSGHTARIWCGTPTPDLPVKQRDQCQFVLVHELGSILWRGQTGRAHLCVKAWVLAHVADVDGQTGGSHQLGDAVIDQPIGTR